MYIYIRMNVVHTYLQTCKKKPSRWEKFWPLTLVMCLLWILFFYYFIIWWATIIGQVIIEHLQNIQKSCTSLESKLMLY